MGFELRDYQNKIIEETRQKMKQGFRSVLIQAPTASGKTALTAQMLANSAEKGLNSLFVVHRRELVKQSCNAFKKINIPYGVISAGFFPSVNKPIQIGSIQTLIRRVNKIKKPKLIVIDESHHLRAKSWEGFINQFPDSFIIGLTATPCRLDGRGLGKHFQVMVNGPPIEWLIENKYLCNFRAFVPSTVNLSGVHTQMGDYVKTELVNIMDKPHITGDAIREYKKICPNKRAIVFAVGVEHSKHIVEQFNSNGIKAKHVDAKTPMEERDLAIKLFAAGEIKILSNVDLFGEGFDLPALDAIIMLRPTHSLGMYLQMIGRVLRPYPGKEFAIILDHAGNIERHGLPDEPREWSLADRPRSNKKSDGGNLFSVKICPRCFGASKAGGLSCKFCGTVFEIKARKIEEVDGDLVEISSAKIKKDRAWEQTSARSLEDLFQMAKERNYRYPRQWAQHVFQSRQRKKLSGGS